MLLNKASGMLLIRNAGNLRPIATTAWHGGFNCSLRVHPRELGSSSVAWARKNETPEAEAEAPVKRRGRKKKDAAAVSPDATMSLSVEEEVGQGLNQQGSIRSANRVHVRLRKIIGMKCSRESYMCTPCHHHAARDHPPDICHTYGRRPIERCDFGPF